MNLHEFQAKQLFKQFGLPVPLGEVAQDINDAVKISEKFRTSKLVVKAQVHAGGRGKAGGVKLVSDREALVNAVKTMLGTRLVTYQTDERGQPVNQVLIEETCEIKTELYLGAVIDRSTRRVVLMISTEGGVEIEKVAASSPEKILKITVNPLLGVLPFQCRDVGFKLGFDSTQLKQFTQIVISLVKMVHDLDLSLVEINPLVIQNNGNLLCLDAKVNIDDNALYRQAEIKALKDKSQEDDRVNRAHDWDLNYVPLEGNIGCMVNGAGLAMATMDIVKLHGGSPANFLDVGGSATRERVSEAFKIILEDKNVIGILVNIFGGIVRCDLIADGIIGAVSDIDTRGVPIVVRLEGNNAKLGAEKLGQSGLNIIPAMDLDDAARKVVNAVRGKS